MTEQKHRYSLGYNHDVCEICGKNIRDAGLNTPCAGNETQQALVRAALDRGFALGVETVSRMLNKAAERMRHGVEPVPEDVSRYLWDMARNVPRERDAPPQRQTDPLKEFARLAFQHEAQPEDVWEFHTRYLSPKPGTHPWNPGDRVTVGSDVHFAWPAGILRKHAILISRQSSVPREIVFHVPLQNTDAGWYYWNRDFTEKFGPYPSESDARQFAEKEHGKQK